MLRGWAHLGRVSCPFALTEQGTLGLFSAEVDLSVPVNLEYVAGEDQTRSCGRHLEATVLSAEHTAVLQRWNRCSALLSPLPGQLFIQRASPAVKLEPHD